MKRLKINAGGRPLWNDDLERLDEINALLESLIAGRAVLPYVMQGCILESPAGTVYPVSAGIVFLNGKLLAVDATTLDLSAPKYLNAGTPVDSSFRTHEVGTSLACYAETKAEYKLSAPSSGQYLICTSSGIGEASDRFWESFATDTALAGVSGALNSAINTEIINRTTADTTLQTQINSLLALINTAITDLATNYYTKSQVDAQDAITLASANTYTDAKFTLSWVTFASGLECAKDMFGFVHLRGSVNTTTTTVFATLPSGYLPASGYVRYTTLYGATNNFSYCQINTSGQLVFRNSNTGTACEIDLQNVTPFIGTI